MPDRRGDMPTLADLRGHEMLEILGTNITMICKREVSQTSTSSNQYNNYRKLVNNNLLKLNSNISEMLTESFKGIDSICSKVRECISDFNAPELLEASLKRPIPNRAESFADDKNTQQIIEKQKQEQQVKYAELTKRYEEYRQKLRADGGLPLELDASLYDEPGNKKEQEAGDVQEVPVVEEIPEQNESDDCKMKIEIDYVNLDAAQDIEVIEELVENAEVVNPPKIEEQNTDAVSLDNLSEIIELLPSTENVNVAPNIKKLKRRRSKSQLERPKKRLRRRFLEEYTRVVQKEVDKADFESLQEIIQNITDRIDLLTSETLNENSENINKPEETKDEKEDEEYKDGEKEDKEGEKKEKEGEKEENEDFLKESSFACLDPNEREIIDDLFVSTTESIKELLGAALSKALATTPVKRGKPRLNLTEVHHRPTFTNLRKKLLLQADANESFLDLQRIIDKHKKKNPPKMDRELFSKLKVPLRLNSSSESLKDEETSELNIQQESEDEQLPDFSSKYADSLYFNEKNMFKYLPQHRHGSKKSISNYSSSMPGMERNTQKISPTMTTVKLTKNTPRPVDGGKSKNKYNYFKSVSGSSSLNVNSPKQRTCKQNSVMAAGKRCDNKENVRTMVERNSSSYSLPNTKSSTSSVNVLKSRTNVVAKRALSKANMNDPTKTAPCEDEDNGLTTSALNGIPEGVCFSCSGHPVCQCGVTNSSNGNDDRTANKTSMRSRNDMQMGIRGLDYLDILDDLTHKDLLPIRSEYPRKDLQDEKEVASDQNKDIHDTYLWKMMYGKEKSDNVWSHLLQPKVECIDKTCHFYDHQEKDKQRIISTPVSVLDLNDKTFRALKQKSKRKTIEKLTPYLFDPKEERNNQSLIVMPVRVHYDNPPFHIIKHNTFEEPEILPTATPKSVKKVKTSKLEQPSMKEVKTERAKWDSPAKSKKRITSIQSITKSNVKVHKIEETKKEKQSVSAKKVSNPVMNKPLTTYVPSSDDPPTEPQKLTPQQTAYKKAIMRNLNRLMEIKQKEKKEQKELAAKDLALQQKYLATTNYPHYARPTIQSQNYFQRPPVVAPTSELKIDTDKKHAEANAMNVIKKLVDIKSAAEHRKPTPRAVEAPAPAPAAFSDTKSDYERKMLSYKYGKSVGEQLIKFLNHQPPSPSCDGSNSPKVGSATGSKFLNPNLMKGDNAKNAPLASAAHKSTMNHKQVLLHLKGLKKKNSQVQNNIQKSILAIEDIMVDILSAPGTNTSLEAFDAMEKEITTVLGMIKGTNSGANNRDSELENNLQDISVELFSKLEKILDSEHSKEATSASDTDGKVTVQSNGEGKKKKSRKAANRHSSVTTLLAEEKSRKSQHGAKQKIPTQAQSETKLKTTQDFMPIEKETMATPENVVKSDDDISEHIFETKENIDRDQGDQPDKETVTKADVVFSDSELDVIWDTNEQINRLDKMLNEFKEGNANQSDEAVLIRQNATTRLETLSGEGNVDEDEEAYTKELLESINSRMNTFLEPPLSDEMPVSTLMEELSESIDRAENDYYNPESKDFPSPRCECSSTADTKDDPSLSTPCITGMSYSDSSLSEFPHKEDSSTVSPIDETTSSDEGFMTPLRTDPNLTSLDDDFLTPPEDMLLARLEEDGLSSPDEQMFTSSRGQRDDDDDELPSPIQEELWTSRDEMSPITEELLMPLTDEMLTSLADEMLTPLTDEMLTPLTDEMLMPPTDGNENLFTVSKEETMMPPVDEVSAEGVILGSLDEFENEVASDSDDGTSDISVQMNEIIKKVEDIYAQLNHFQSNIDEKPAIPVFSDEKNLPQIPSEEFLTPFMHAVRDTRSRRSGDVAEACANSLESSPSFCNILNFLETLNADADAETDQEVHTTQLYNSAYSYCTPSMLYQATVEYPLEYSDSCLKMRDDFKRKKEVSFSVTENELSQASFQEHLSKSLSNVLTLRVSMEDRPGSAEEMQPDDSSEYSFTTVSSVESPRTVIPSKDYSEPPDKSTPINGSYGKQISLFTNRTTEIDPKIEVIGDGSSTTAIKEMLFNFECSPSFCSLLNFFDTFNEMDAETPQEIHTARLCETAYAYSIPSVLHQATIEYPIEYSMPDKHGCLKTSNDTKRKKKVSFFEFKEDRSAESSFRMIKRTKMSIEQLPQLEGSKERLELPTKMNSSNDSSEKEYSCMFGDTTPHFETVRNTSKLSILDDASTDVIGNQRIFGTPRVTVVREYSLERPKNCNRPKLAPSKEMLMENKDSNVVFLKSVYAFMYLLVFTALNMEYKCY